MKSLLKPRELGRIYALILTSAYSQEMPMPTMNASQIHGVIREPYEVGVSRRPFERALPLNPKLLFTPTECTSQGLGATHHAIFTAAPGMPRYRAGSSSGCVHAPGEICLAFKKSLSESWRRSCSKPKRPHILIHPALLLTQSARETSNQFLLRTAAPP